MYSFSITVETNCHKASGLTQHKFISLTVPSIRSLTWTSLGSNQGVSRARFLSEDLCERTCPLDHSSYWRGPVLVIGGLRCHFLAECQLRTILHFWRSPICLGCDLCALSSKSRWVGKVLLPLWIFSCLCSLWLEMLSPGYPLRPTESELLGAGPSNLF